MTTKQPTQPIVLSYYRRAAGEPLGYDRVSQSTRAPRDGRVITCPNCAANNTVYHFTWSALYCTPCGQFVAKTDWLVK